MTLRNGSVATPSLPARIPKPNVFPPQYYVRDPNDEEVCGFRACPALDYLKTRGWSNDTVQKVMAWMTDNQATGKDGAKYFLKNYEPVWTKWVSPQLSAKIKAAL